MEQRIYHGAITPTELGQAIAAKFSRGNLRVQQFGNQKKIMVQIATQEWLRSGGRTALSVLVEEIEDGIGVQIGKQSWYGIAASLGQTALATILNPWNLLSRLDDLAQDYESLTLVQEVWEVIDETARAARASVELSDRLRRVVCSYCLTANPVGEPSCIACGAPLGNVQPLTCPNCGYAVKRSEKTCPNCGFALDFKEGAA